MGILFSPVTSVFKMWDLMCLRQVSMLWNFCLFLSCS